MEAVINREYQLINPKQYLILQVIRELNARKYSLKVGRIIYQKICYVLTRNGVNTGFKFVKGDYGPCSSEVEESITTLINKDLIIEKPLGRMNSLSVADHVIIQQEKFSNDEWEAVRKTVDLFGRVKCTDQAEMLTIVLYSYDQLAKLKENISDKDVYDFVFDWKPYWKVDKEYEICNTIQNMAMLSLINVSHSKELMETESIL